VDFNAKLSTSKDYTAGFVTKDLFVKGAKIDFQGTSNEKDGLVLKLSPSYKSDNLHGQFTCSYPFLQFNKKTPPPLKWIFEGVFLFSKKIFLGLNFLIDQEYTHAHAHSKKKLEGAIVSHATHNSAVAARASYDLNEESLVWGFSFFQELSHTTKLSADYEFDSKGPTAKIGGEYKVDDRTTLKGLATVKSETGAPTDYRLGLSVKQNVSKHLKATLCADINVRNILGEGTGQAHSVGCEVEISAL